MKLLVVVDTLRDSHRLVHGQHLQARPDTQQAGYDSGPEHQSEALRHAVTR